MLGLTIIGIALILFGLITCTEWVDNYWRNRSTVKTFTPTVTPPFRYTPTQCVTCGKDGDLLSIDTGQCFICFEVSYGR